MKMYRLIITVPQTREDLLLLTIGLCIQLYPYGLSSLAPQQLAKQKLKKTTKKQKINEYTLLDARRLVYKNKSLRKRIGKRNLEFCLFSRYVKVLEKLLRN